MKSGAFHKDQVLSMLGQPGCVGLRIHYGRNADGSPALVLTGIDATDSDLTGDDPREALPLPALLRRRPTHSTADRRVRVPLAPVSRSRVAARTAGRGARGATAAERAARMGARLVRLPRCAGTRLSSRSGGRHRNLFLTYFWSRPSAAPSCSGRSHRGNVASCARLTLRLAIVPFVLAWVVLTFAFDDTETFSRVADPMASLVGLGAAAFTLVARSYVASGLLRRQDWFWVSAGMVLYFGTATMLQPLSALLIGDAPQLMVRAFEVKSVLDVFAFLLIARGVTCPAAT